MIKIRKADERGHADYGWLSTYHTFSFDTYYDAAYMGFRSLRVINEDRVQPGNGFPSHFHRDMEIISYVLEGALEHRDSLGTGSIIRPGDVQRMSAGTGVTHSEYNPSQTDIVHFLQIWILPERKGLKPSYEQKRFSDEEKRGTLRLIASREGRDGSVSIHQNASVYATSLDIGQELVHPLKPGRHAWAQVVRGRATFNDRELKQGDGAAASEEKALKLASREGAEVLVFDLA